MKKISLILIFVLLLCFGCGGTATAFAVTANDTIQYTNVMDDLAEDPMFDASKYPIDYTNGKLELLTVAESVNNELFVYVYSPAILRAASINISLVEKDVDYKVYGLTLINSHDGFFKYKVDGLTVSSDETRYYEISSISRRFISDFDEELDNGNTVSMTPFKVGKAFTFTGSGSTLSLSVKDVEVITVTDKYVGFIRYPDGGIFASATACDVHFVSFSTDKKMKNLLEADVYYTYQTYYSHKGGSTGDIVQFGEVTPDTVYLKSDIDVTYTGDGWFSSTYQWNSIEKSDAFLENEQIGQMYEAGIFDVEVQSNLSKESEDKIRSHDWVLRFALTDYNTGTYNTNTFVVTEKEFTIIADVSILRLAFVTDGDYYNLGVVDNMQSKPVDPDTGEPVPDNPDGPIINVTIPEVDSFFDKLKTIGLWVLGAVLIFLGWNVLRWVVDFLRGK
ncbi:MAG: hypothetical protein IJV77_05075 [Clostridia bacterium]|nr:hypothetical protein [Clostridia bacterium]